MPGQLVEEAELGPLRARLRVVGLLLALGRAANPRHGAVPAWCPPDPPASQAGLSAGSLSGGWGLAASRSVGARSGSLACSLSGARTRRRTRGSDRPEKKKVVQPRPIITPVSFRCARASRSGGVPRTGARSHFFGPGGTCSKYQKSAAFCNGAVFFSFFLFPRSATKGRAKRLFVL